MFLPPSVDPGSWLINLEELPPAVPMVSGSPEMVLDRKVGDKQDEGDRPIGGLLRYGLPGIGVTGVGASLPLKDAIFPARRQAGGISTAAAIHNLGEESMVVSCRLMSGGVVLEEVEILLGPNGQEARYIEEGTVKLSRNLGLWRRNRLT